MMKHIIPIILLIVISASCRTTKSDATKWFNDHREEAAEYCSERFPTIVKVDTITKQQDSTAYYKALSNLWRLTDSARKVLEASGKIDSFYLESLLPCLGTETIITRTEINRDSIALLTMRLRSSVESGMKKDVIIESIKKESEKLKQTSKNRLWIIIAFAATMLGIIIIKAR